MPTKSVLFFELFLLLTITSANHWDLTDVKTSVETGPAVKQKLNTNLDSAEISKKYDELGSIADDAGEAGNNVDKSLLDTEERRDDVDDNKDSNNDENYWADDHQNDEVNKGTSNEANLPVPDEEPDAVAMSSNDDEKLSGNDLINDHNPTPDAMAADDENTDSNLIPMKSQEKVPPCWNKFGIKWDMKKLSTLASFKLSSLEMKKFKIWPQGTIPYYIDDFSFDKILRDKIRGHLDYARSISGINFEELPHPPKNEDERWVFFVNRRGQLECKDYNTNSFTNSGVQKVILGYDCLDSKGPLAAIVLALAGIPPQHNSPDRDRFIKVSLDAVEPDKKRLFHCVTDDEWLFHDLDYDYASAGHYPAYKYTNTGSSTIKAINKNEIIAGRDDYSQMDVEKIRMLYNNLIKNDPNRGIKSDECQALYRPGPNFRNVKPKTQKLIAERPKPKKYLAAIGKN